VRPPTHAVTARSKLWLEGTLPTTTVSVRRRVGKRSQHAPKLSAPWPQPKRAWGQPHLGLTPTCSARALTSIAAAIRRTRTPTPPNEDACRTIECVGINTTAELREVDCPISSRRLDDLRDLLTLRLSGRMRESQALRSVVILMARQAPAYQICHVSCPRFA